MKTIMDILTEVIKDMGVSFFLEGKKLLIIDSYEGKGRIYAKVKGLVDSLSEDTSIQEKVNKAFMKNTYFSSDSEILNLFVEKDLMEGNAFFLENPKSNKKGTNKHMNKLKVDKVIMNPPYDMGGVIWDMARNVSNSVVCLMPLVQYKKGDRIKYIESYEPTGGSGFDAIITDNLGITICKSGEYHKENTYEKFELFSYDEKFRPFYERNIERNHYAIDSYSHNSSLPKRTPSSKTDFYVTGRAAKDGVHIEENSYDKMWNINKNISLDLMPKPIDKKSGKIKMYRGGWVQFNTEIENSNYCKWHYYKGKNGLAHFLIKGLNKSDGNIKVAMPKIDWASISDHPLWKEGRYDEAVLDAMGLKWEGDKIVEI